MKKLSLISLAITLVITLSLAGCSGSKSAATADGKAVKMTYWTFQPLHVKFYKEMVKEWNKAHPDKPIDLAVQSFPYNDEHNKLQLALQSGVGAPDIADIEISRFSNFLKGKPQLVDLNDIVNPVKDKIVPSRLKIYSKDGKVYGLPTHVGATVMYYNKELLDKAGVDPNKIDTWADYVEAGKKVVAATGKPMTTVETTDLWSYWPLVVQQGSDFFDKDGKVTLDNETNVKTLQFLHDMVYKDKIAVPAPGGRHHAEEYYGFMDKGGAASVIMPMWYMGRFTDYMPDLKGKIIIRPLPKWTKDGKRSAGMGGTGTVITTQSKNVERAKEFLAFAKLSKEGNIAIWKVLGFDPPRWDVWDAPELKEPNKYTDYFGKDIFNTLISLKNEIDSPNITENTPKANTLVGSSILFKVIKQQSQTPEQALKSVVEEMNK